MLDTGRSRESDVLVLSFHERDIYCLGLTTLCLRKKAESLCASSGRVMCNIASAPAVSRGSAISVSVVEFAATDIEVGAAVSELFPDFTTSTPGLILRPGKVTGYSMMKLEADEIMLVYGLKRKAARRSAKVVAASIRRIGPLEGR
jgi:hypothetical protein